MSCDDAILPYELFMKYNKNIADRRISYPYTSKSSLIENHTHPILWVGHYACDNDCDCGDLACD